MDAKTKLIIVQFIKFCKDQLKIRKPFTVKLVKTRDADLSTYAYYDPINCIVKVYVKSRGLGDICRSVSHEIYHHYQNQEGKLTGNIPDVGGEIEDDANAESGKLVKLFGRYMGNNEIYSGYVE